MRCALSFILACAALLVANPAHAQTSDFTVEGRLFDASSNAPSTSTNAKIMLEVVDSSAVPCTLYREIHSNVNLNSAIASAQGTFALRLGQGGVQFTGSTLTNLFSTSATVSGIRSDTPVGSEGGGITCAPNSNRLVRVSVYDTTSSGWDHLSPDTAITSTPSTMVAETLQGHGASDFLLTNANTSLSQPSLEYLFTATNYASLKALVDGTSSQYLQASPSANINANAHQINNVSDPSAAQDAATKNYSDTNIGGKGFDVAGVAAGIGGGRTIVWDSAQNKWVTAATGSVGLVDSGVGLTGGPITSAGTLSVDVGTTSGKILQLDALARIPSVDGSLLANVNAMFISGREVSAAAPAAQQVLAWNNISSLWEPTSTAGGTITALTGDVTASGNGSVTATIQPDTITSAKINSTGVFPNRLLITDATTGASVRYLSCAVNETLQWTASGWQCKDIVFILGNVNASSAGTYGSGAEVPQVTVDLQGRVTAITNVNIAFPVSSVNGKTGVVNLNTGDIADLGSHVLMNGGNSFGADAEVGTNDANALVFKTDGMNRMFIDGAGNVGIGTTNPSEKLEVAGKIKMSGAGNGITFPDGTTQTTAAAAGGDFMKDGSVAMTGPLNMGTKAIANAGAVTAEAFIPTGTSIPNYGLYKPNATTLAISANNSPALKIGNSNNVSIGGGNATGAFAFATGSGTSAPAYVQTVFGAYNQTTGTEDPANWVATDPLFVLGNGTSPGSKSNALTVLKNGWVGIGTDVPSAKLTIQNTTGYGDLLWNECASGGFCQGIFKIGGVRLDVGANDSGAGNTYIGSNSNHDFQIRTNNSPRLTVTAAGKVGIGTNAPGYTLDVAGTINASSFLVNGVPIGSGNGTVTNVNAGPGLLGGTITSGGTLSVDVGTTAYKILQLDSNAKLPAVDGSQLTNISASASQILGRPLGITPPADSQLLTFNGTTSQWEARTPGQYSQWLNGGSDISYTLGNIGVGTNAPAQRLHVANGALMIQDSTGNTYAQMYLSGNHVYRILGGTGSSNGLGLPTGAFAIYDGSMGASRLTIDSLGNIGIGTANPTDKLTVAGNDYSSVQSNVASASSYPAFLTSRSRGTQTSKVSVNNGDVAGVIIARAYDGSAPVDVASIYMEVDGAPSTGDMPGRIVFKTTADGASSSVNRMVIKSSGYVGIGTLNPTSALDVAGDLKAEHILGNSPTPSCNVTAGAAGGIPTCQLYQGSISGGGIPGGNDNAHVLKVVTTAAGNTTAGAVFATVNFSTVLSTVPTCVFSPGNSATGNLSGAGGLYIQTTAAGYSLIKVGSTAIGAATYEFQVHCMQ